MDHKDCKLTKFYLNRVGNLTLSEPLEISVKDKELISFDDFHHQYSVAWVSNSCFEESEFSRFLEKHGKFGEDQVTYNSLLKELNTYFSEYPMETVSLSQFKSYILESAHQFNDI